MSKAKTLTINFRQKEINFFLPRGINRNISHIQWFGFSSSYTFLLFQLMTASLSILPELVKLVVQSHEGLAPSPLKELLQVAFYEVVPGRAL